MSTLPRRAVAPVEVAPPLPAARAWRVRAIVPCYNRRADLERLIGDLGRLGGTADRCELSVLVVDNASSQPVAGLDAPPGLAVEVRRLARNTGGSGGFNAGMRATLLDEADEPERELLWLLDSDARVDAGALLELLRVIESRPDAVVVGSALAEPATGRVFELGGRLNRRTGELEQPLPAWAYKGESYPDSPEAVEVEYVAACSMLVRRAAVEGAGLMAEVFLNGDDVEWCLRLARVTGGRVLVAPRSVVRHPSPDKMRTWDRYYVARNAFAVLREARLGARVRWRRALREVGRAVCQTLVGRDDLAALHLRGLADAAAGRTTGAAEPALSVHAFRPLDELGSAVLECGAAAVTVGGSISDSGAIRRRLEAAGVTAENSGGPGWVARFLWPPRVALVSARGRARDWLAGRTLVTVSEQGFAVRRIRRAERLFRLAGVLARGSVLAARLALAGPGLGPRIPLAPAAKSVAARVSAVVLSYNRRPALERTLSGLTVDAAVAEIVVVDNGSTDGSAAAVAERFPGVGLLALGTNAGVAGFNRGVARASGEYVLVLDDDAVPAEGVLAAAVRLLGERPDLAAVALHPRHPETRKSEWPFAERAAPCDDWPVMGCGNLVRREAWRRLGGYEEGFFLYRNDTDLALRLLGAGFGVHFNPDWVVWHDSLAAARKSPRWFELATRNWVWMCRRNGRGPTAAAMAAAGWAWAHRAAGLDLRAHARVVKGAAAGVLRRPPVAAGGAVGAGAALRRLLRLRARRRA